MILIYCIVTITEVFYGIDWILNKAYNLKQILNLRNKQQIHHSSEIGFDSHILKIASPHQKDNKLILGEIADKLQKFNQYIGMKLLI